MAETILINSNNYVPKIITSIDCWYVSTGQNIAFAEFRTKAKTLLRQLVVNTIPLPTSRTHSDEVFLLLSVFL